MAGSKKRKAGPAKESAPKKRTKRNQHAADDLIPGQLSILPTAPLDVLFQIFAFLEPLDLMCLSSVNRAFRECLFDEQANGLWRGARQRSRVPDPPPYFKEQRWVTFLFGRSCPQCGTASPQKIFIDFRILRKFCVECSDKEQGCVEYRGKDLNHITPLLPFYRGLTHLFQPQDSPRTFKQVDVSNVQQQVERLAKAIMNGVNDAQISLKTYREQQYQFVRTLRQHEQEYVTWFSLHTIISRPLNPRQQGILDRFLKEGYDSSVIRQALHKINTTYGGLVTDRTWDRVREAIEPVIQGVIRENESVVIPLKESGRLTPAWLEYLRRVPREQWTEIPMSGLHSIQRADRATQRRFIKQMGNTSNSKQLRPDFASLIPQWRTNLRIELWRQVDRYAGTRSPLYLPNVSPYSTSATDVEKVMEVLQLAVAIFICTLPGDCVSDPLVISWSGCLAHGCTALGLYVDGIKLATSLVKSVGLDPYSVTPAEMDETNALFSCKTCLEEAENATARFVYNWREALHHLSVMPKGHNKFELLEQQDVSKIVIVQKDPQLDEALWMCGHCLEYLETLANYEEVAQHVKSRHSVCNSISHQDVVLGPNKAPSLYSRRAIPLST